eukprot:gnl/MRDRNA2_/MRDRNA2_160918_c0_seq1.p1 gnl/MRDRNA2_/MRDRNA2_160918_c0~~gnl/MRDRNA2_/MRDRNA2_160918_c0_seq1.p1  ORF type:complete len:276 (+),score=30.02 gnl/MRDRNA2_/MRDRNA2_160918_c0_seq1:121-828(+)
MEVSNEHVDSRRFDRSKSLNTDDASLMRGKWIMQDKAESISVYDYIAQSPNQHAHRKRGRSNSLPLQGEAESISAYDFVARPPNQHDHSRRFGRSKSLDRKSSFKSNLQGVHEVDSISACDLIAEPGAYDLAVFGHSKSEPCSAGRWKRCDQNRAADSTNTQVSSVGKSMAESHFVCTGREQRLNTAKFSSSSSTATVSTCSSQGESHGHRLKKVLTLLTPKSLKARSTSTLSIS